MKPNLKIDSIRIIKDIDINPDLSYLGDYTDNFDNNAIIVKFGKYYHELTKAEKADFPQKGRECRFFKPYSAGLNPPDKLYYRYGKKDFKRTEAFKNDLWTMLYIGVEALIYINDIRQKITSSFIGSVESDSKPAYIRQIIREQKAELIEQLKAIGFSSYAIRQAMQNI